MYTVYNYTSSEALPGPHWTKALDATSMVVNLVPSGMFLSFLFKAEDYFDKNKENRDSMNELEEKICEDDSVIEELSKEKEEEEDLNEVDVIRVEGIYPNV